MGWGVIYAILEFFKAPNEAPVKVRYAAYTNEKTSYETRNKIDETDAKKEKKGTSKAHKDAVKLASPFDKNARFEILNTDHQKYAEHLIKQFFRGNPQTTQKFFEYAYDKVNLELLHYAMVTGIINRKDKELVDVKMNLLSPHVNIQVNPEKYIDMKKIKTDVQNDNYKTLKSETSEAKTIFVHINDDVEISTNPNVYYFERDIELNMHYRRWYEFNPRQEIIPMIRRGESFHYKHQQLLARYNFERLCNGLSAVEPSHFENFEIIKESEQGSKGSDFEHLCKIYEKSFFSNLRSTNKGSKRLFDNILQAETALRNESFYSQYKRLDDSFHQKKSELFPYAKKDIQFEGIRILSVTIQPQILETFWEKDTIDITHKFSLPQFKKIYAVHTHLQHEEFKYEIRFKNSTDENVSGTVRIFLAPQLGEQTPYHEKRRMFVEMDKFVIQLEACKTTSITRESKHSSVVKEPYGWPRHLLVGKGTEEGFPCDLFVIITQNKSNKLEEDEKMMGFPFDRKILNEDNTENDILKTPFGNMSLKRIQIKHQAQKKFFKVDDLKYLL